MKKAATDRREAARVCWESLEELPRQRVQGYVQDLLEDEVAELLSGTQSYSPETTTGGPGGGSGWLWRRVGRLCCRCRPGRR